MSAALIVALVGQVVDEVGGFSARPKKTTVDPSPWHVSGSYYLPGPTKLLLYAR